MSESIPQATPYPWAPTEQQISRPVIRKRKGSGFSVLYDALDSPSTSNRCKEILNTLLDDDDATDRATSRVQLATVSLVSAAPQRTIDPTLRDEQVLQMAGQISLLGSIVQLIRTSPTPVPTKQILRTCCLAVPPRDVPPHMDAKEMVLAALHFLSTTHTSEHWELPLIRPLAQDNDLEKRVWESSAAAALSPSSLQWLETAFLKSVNSAEYLGRDKRCPRLLPQEEGPLLLKGTLPASVLPPKSQAATSRKRKTPSASKSSPEGPAVAVAMVVPPPMAFGHAWEG